MFNGYLAESGYLTTEECAPYIDGQKGCFAHSKCPAIAKVEKSYYLGKGYGDYGEKTMMKELLRNGVINAEYQGSAAS